MTSSRRPGLERKSETRLWPWFSLTLNQPTVLFSSGPLYHGSQFHGLLPLLWNFMSQYILFPMLVWTWAARRLLFLVFLYHWERLCDLNLDTLCSSVTQDWLAPFPRTLPLLLNDFLLSQLLGLFVWLPCRSPGLHLPSFLSHADGNPQFVLLLPGSCWPHSEGPASSSLGHGTGDTFTKKKL